MPMGALPRRIFKYSTNARILSSPMPLRQMVTGSTTLGTLKALNMTRLHSLEYSQGTDSRFMKAKATPNHGMGHLKESKCLPELITILLMPRAALKPIAGRLLSFIDVIFYW